MNLSTLYFDIGKEPQFTIRIIFGLGTIGNTASNEMRQVEKGSDNSDCIPAGPAATEHLYSIYIVISRCQLSLE